MEARYSIESPRRIALRFQAGGISNVNISSFTETLIAPALVGRNFISHQLLLALQEVRLLDLLGLCLATPHVARDCRASEVASRGKLQLSLPGCSRVIFWRLCIPLQTLEPVSKCRATM